MARVVIDIPDEDFSLLCEAFGEVELKSTLNLRLQSAVAHGTPVSNEGDLIHRSELKKAIMHDLGLGDEENGSDAEYMTGLQDCYQLVDNFPVVEEKSQSDWIPVSERWPAFSGLYLVSIDDLVTVANFTGAYFINKKDLMLNVSAWQELPEPYKKGSGNG